MEIYCRPLETVPYSNYIKFREVCSGQSTLVLAAVVNLLEFGCKLKGTKLSVQIFQLFEDLLNTTTGTHRSLFEELLSVLKHAEYVQGLCWLEQYITQNSNNILYAIQTTISLALGIETFENNQLYLDYLSDKLNICINIEGYLKSSSPQQRLVVNIYYNSEDNKYFLLYTKDFFNYYKNTEVPMSFYSNPVKKTENSEKLINTLIKILKNKDLSPEHKEKILAYKLETKDSRVDSLLTPTSQANFAYFTLNKTPCVLCKKLTQHINPIEFCPTHPLCLLCASKATSCPVCQHHYSDTSLTFLVNN